MATKTKTPKPSKLASNLRTAREAAGLTQLALAKSIGLKGRDAGAYISRIESGANTRPWITNLAKIAAALGIKLEALLQ